MQIRIRLDLHDLYIRRLSASTLHILSLRSPRAAFGKLRNSGGHVVRHSGVTTSWAPGGNAQHGPLPPYCPAAQSYTLCLKNGHIVFTARALPIMKFLKVGWDACIGEFKTYVAFFGHHSRAY